MKRLAPLAFVAFLVAAACATMSPDARQIRDARAAFNAAISRHDVDAIAALLLPSYHLITGRSVQLHGAEKNRENWADAFRNDPAVSYVRTLREIRVNERWGLAQETGEWVGRLNPADGKVDVSGVYAAKWQRSVNGRWLLQSEVFTTLSCAGGASGCRPPDPISP